MASAVVNSTDVDVKRKTTKLDEETLKIVDENNYSKLMYYVNCIATVLRLDDDPEISRLRDYKRYRTLTEEEKQKLILFCVIMDPDVLNDKVLFQKDSMCIEYQNEFYDLDIASTTVAVTQSIMIGGTRKQVRKIMAYTKSWLKENYTDPLEQVTTERRRQRAQRPPTASTRSRQAEDDGRCHVM